MTRPSFELALRKGDVGEELVRCRLEAQGWVVYKPITDKAHAFDILCIKNKRTAIAMDVKAKARLNKYPATGINQKHFEEYKYFSEKHLMDFWVIFVDEMQKSVYGNRLTELEKPRTVEGKTYPWVMPTKGQPVRLWPLEAMITIGSIDAETQARLVDLSQRNYSYEVAQE